MIKVLYDSEDAAQKVTITGWKSRRGIFYGEDEHLARFDGCTHRICACGNEMERSYTSCEDCRAKNSKERYLAMPFKEWDGSTMLVTYDNDTYFSDENDVLNFCEDKEIEPQDLQLVICEPQYAWEISDDYFCDILPEDMTLDDCYSELAEAIGRVNELIRKKEKPISWSAGKYRTTINKKAGT